MNVETVIWTINLKSFEIFFLCFYWSTYNMNYKLEKFWNANKGYTKDDILNKL